MMKEVGLEEFIRVFPQRTPNMMWFLGAGASAASGIKTAWNMIWEFKRALYCAQTRTPVASLPMSELGDASVRARIQRHFDGRSGYPPEDHEDEYSHYFEAFAPSLADRRRYVEKMVSEGTPSYGHKALALLLAHDKSRVVWTTNFDTMVEDAAFPVFGSTGRLMVAALGEPDKMLNAMNEGPWPALGKIHGDFQSRRLKNTEVELRSQDERMRYAMVEACKRYGLAVVGYSGRDHSVMHALEEAIAGGKGFPEGLFWFRRTGSPVLPAVNELLHKAANAGIETCLVSVETFDELLDGTITQIEGMPVEALEGIKQNRPRVTDAPISRPGGHWPTIRLNALPVTEFPTVCRRVVCDIGGQKEVRERLSAYTAEVVACRRREAVLAFGSDAQVRGAFGPYNIKEFDLHPIDPKRLNYESGEVGLLYDALCRAIRRERPLRVESRRDGHMLIVDLKCQQDPCLKSLQAASGRLGGHLQRANLRWAQAARIHLEQRFETLWLLIEPTTWVERTDDPAQKEMAKEFIREQGARRYNQNWGAIFNGWMDALIGDGGETTLRAFGTGEGVDATFRLQKKTAFSKRAT